MKACLTIVLILTFSFMGIALAARGGGRGGGGGRIGGGGIGRGAAPMRPISTPTPQYIGQRNIGAGQINRGQIQQRLQTNSQGIGQNRQTFQQFQAARQPNNLAARQALSRVQANHPGYQNWFNNQRYSNIPSQNWWNGTNWAALNGWVAGDWSTPVYYSYLEEGEPEPIQIEGMPPPPIPRASYAPTAKEDWIPLGIFAAAKDVDQIPHSNMFIQLALNRDGDIAGAYYNAATDQLHPLDGTLSKTTQVVAWRVADNESSPLMQTGLYNLTQDVTPVQVQFIDSDTTQTWYMVRMKLPEGPA